MSYCYRCGVTRELCPPHTSPLPILSYLHRNMDNSKINTDVWFKKVTPTLVNVCVTVNPARRITGDMNILKRKTIRKKKKLGNSVILTYCVLLVGGCNSSIRSRVASFVTKERKINSPSVMTWNGSLTDYLGDLCWSQSRSPT